LPWSFSLFPVTRHLILEPNSRDDYWLLRKITVRFQGGLNFLIIDCNLFYNTSLDRAVLDYLLELDFINFID